MSRRFLLPIALNQVAALGFGLIGIVAVSHVVPKPVYGVYGLFLTLTQVGLMLTHSGLINHATRYWQRDRNLAGSYARFLLLQSWRQSIPLAGLLLIVSLVQAFRHGSVWIQLWPLLVVSNLVVALATLGNAALNAGERHWAVFALNVLASGARALLPVGLALLLGATLLNLSLGFALHAIAVGFALVVLFRRGGWTAPSGPEWEKKWHGELRDFGRPFVAMGIGGWLLQNADRWVVSIAFGEEQLGLFNFASNIASIVPNLVVAGLLQWVFPSMFRQADAAKSMEDWRNLARRCDRFTFFFLGVTVTGLVSLWLIGPYLIGWILSEQYARSMPLLLPAGLAAAALQANQFQYLLLQGQHDSNSMVRVMVLLAGVRTIGSILAAAISWPVFVGWLTLSTALISVLGRFRIQQIVFQKVAAAKKEELRGQARG